MVSIIEKLRKFFSYWYLRYLLVTELYMVEPWEKVVIQATVLCFFALFWFVNKSVLLAGIGHLRNSSSNLELMT